MMKAIRTLLMVSLATLVSLAYAADGQMKADLGLPSEAPALVKTIFLLPKECSATEMKHLSKIRGEVNPIGATALPRSAKITQLIKQFGLAECIKRRLLVEKTPTSRTYPRASHFGRKNIRSEEMLVKITFNETHDSDYSRILKDCGVTLDAYSYGYWTCNLLNAHQLQSILRHSGIESCSTLMLAAPNTVAPFAHSYKD